MSRAVGVPAVAGALLSLLLGGCATPQVAALIAAPPPALPERSELAKTPFFPQERYQCGPAALATVLVQSGVATTPEALVDSVYLSERQGSLQAEMLATARRHGRVAYQLAPRLDELLREVATGTPVVVLQNLAFSFAPRWHYAVVVGYDRTREDIILRSGTTERLVMTLSNFERTWARSEHWAMVAVPPDRLPATAREEPYVAAAVALERVSPNDARRAYATALAHWPRNLLARMGLGNTAYAAKDLATAEREFRKAALDHPDAADAWNNLATVLHETGRKSEALDAARRAIALGGARLPQYERTLRTIAETR
ncbi:MAG: PA2778 family cysteine peptidase [Betaproteobacteria bacterium]